MGRPKCGRPAFVDLSLQLLNSTAKSFFVSPFGVKTNLHEYKDQDANDEAGDRSGKENVLKFVLRHLQPHAS